MTRARFLTGSLATLAVASAFTLAAPAAHAEDAPTAPCGTPAVDAVFRTVLHEPVFRTVPATTHSEWLWERDVTTYEHEFSRETRAALTEIDWRRELDGATEYRFIRTVIDQPGVPAVPGTPEVGHFETVVVSPAVTSTEFEYQHRVSNKFKWESEDWGNDPWLKTGNTRVVEITPAVTEQKWIVDAPAVPGTPAIPEVSHVESTWAEDTPDGFDPDPVDSRPGAVVVQEETTNGPAPAGAGWTEVAQRHLPAVVDFIWSAAAPDGYDATGQTRVASNTHEVTEKTSAAAPEGQAWSEVAGSEVVVVDSPESQELVTGEWIEELLVSPAIPAGKPCVAGPVSDPGVGTVAGPTGKPAQAAPAPVASVLPDTGNDVPLWVAPAGLAALLAGLGMIRLGRGTTPEVLPSRQA